jgi:hypothetical protein
VRRFALAAGRRLPSFVRPPAVDAFELDVLGAVTNDYEAVHTMRGDLERDLGRPVSDAELSLTLTRLVELGFVDAFVFDSTLGTYRRAKPGEVAPTELWFFASQAGRTEYERLVA